MQMKLDHHSHGRAKATASPRPFYQWLTLLLLSALLLAACGESDPATAQGEYSFEVRDDDLVIGSRDAPITFVEYSSFTCPHCATFHKVVFPTLKEKYLDTGEAKFVFRHYPLDRFSTRRPLRYRMRFRKRVN